MNVRDATLIERMADTIRHRGPDAGGAWVAPDAALTFGHRRLSILDLNPRGNQPMTYAHGDRNVVITFNGEIYNFAEIRDALKPLGYVFHTTCDTEVILAAYLEWGADAVQRFNGMWAFALWDPSRRTVLLSRDRFGKKPLYLWRSGEHFAFASEIKALLAWDRVPRRANPATAGDYLFRNLVNHTPDTFFEGISMLPAGHNATYHVESRAFERSAYYTPHARGDRVSLAEVDDKLADAVRRRLISDVPVSISLSGGIDSSTIAAILASTAQSKIAAFTTASTAGSRGDETALVREFVARYPVYDLHVRQFDAARFVNEHEAIVQHMEEPLWDDGQYVRWEIAKAVHESGYKVLLTGEAADEVLGGYWPASAFNLRDAIREHAAGRFARELIGALLQPERASILAGILIFAMRSERLVYRRDDAMAKRFRVALPLANPNVFAPIYDGGLKDYCLWLIGTYCLPQLLMCNDKMSMAHSVESRAPFLDVEFVEAALALTTDDLIRWGRRKWVLRETMAERVPRTIMGRRKKESFASPMATFLRTPAMHQRIQDTLRHGWLAQVADCRAVADFHEKHGPTPLVQRFYWLSLWTKLFDVTWSQP